MKLVDDILGSIPKRIVVLIYKIIPNPSEQDQIANHFLPSFFVTTLLILIPKIGIYAGLLWVGVSFFKEFVEDDHWKDFFKFDEENMKSPYGGADGRCDLFFRLAGSGIAYWPEIWR